MRGLVPAVAVVLIAIFVMRRRRPHGSPVVALSKLRGGVEDALEEMEPAIKHLRQRAKGLKGEASHRLQEQARDLEGRQHELRKRLDDLRAEAQQLSLRAKEHVRAGRKALSGS